MSNKSDYFFLCLKQLYPNFSKPSAIDEEIWEDMLCEISLPDIYSAVKSYRKSASGGSIPTPIKFKDFLYPYQKKMKAIDDSLPPCPENTLMEEDIREGRCKYFFGDYKEGVNYVLNEKIKKYVDEKTLATYSRWKRYQVAVDYGLFGDFEEILDFLHKKGNKK